MNEGIIVLVVIAVVGVAYFICAMLNHGLCDVGKVFTLLVVVFGLVTGIFIFIHAYAALKVKATYYEDAVWGAVAGFILSLYSVQQTIVMFREVLAKKVEPLKDERPK